MNRILLVSDDEGLRKTLAKKLLELGFDPYPVSLDQGASEAAWQEYPDLILIAHSVNSHTVRSFCKQIYVIH